MILADSNLGGIITLVAIIVAAAIIAVIAFVIHRILHPKLKGEDDKPSDEEIVNEELQRVLEPIEDDETAKQVNEYKDEE